jgi:N-acyl-L-homoserine lactone synthetase
MIINESISDLPFSDRLLATLDHIEYRRIQSNEDFEDIARLRYRAYKARNVLPVSARSMLDEIDFDDHAYVFGVYYYEELVSTLRIHHVTPDHRVSQSSGIFPEAIDGFLDAGLTLIDPARFAVDAEFANDRATLPYLTVRPTIMAAIHFQADRMLQHIRPQHAAFYKRFFYAQTVVPPTMTKTYGFELTLLASPTLELRAKLMRRFPVFQSEAYERRLMFANGAATGTPALTIIPSARLAGRPNSPEMAFLR